MRYNYIYMFLLITKIQLGQNICGETA